MGYERAEWHSGLTYHQECGECNTPVDYDDYKLGFRPWFPDGFVYCPKCRRPLRHNEKYAINAPAASEAAPVQTEVPVWEMPAAPAPTPAPTPAPAPAAQVPVWEVPATPIVDSAPVVEAPAPAPVVEQPVWASPTPVLEAPVCSTPAPVVETPVVEAPVVEELHLFCPRCGKKFREDDNFCSGCGAKRS